MDSISNVLPTVLVHKSTKKRKRIHHRDLAMLNQTITIGERRQEFLNQNKWIPICDDVLTPSERNTSIATVSLSPDTLSSTVNNTTPTPLTAAGWIMSPNGQYQSQIPTPVSQRINPLPSFEWADSQQVWNTMLSKEELSPYFRSDRVFELHQTLQPRMRTILLDWLMEVCEAYKLRRETFYLTVDLIDRYLSRSINILKTQLQLIGITALFIASKIEEMHPSKVAEMSFVTDGTCTDIEILEQELLILKVLKFDLTPMTVMSWLNLYLQAISTNSNVRQEFMMPQYSQHAFVQTARLLDLCMLDSGCLQYRYSVLTASAIYHMSSDDIALSVSGYQWTDIASCVEWMSAFAATLRDDGPTEIKFFEHVRHIDTHNIQTHSTDIRLLEKAQSRSKLRASCKVVLLCPKTISHLTNTPELFQQRTLKSLTCFSNDCQPLSATPQLTARPEVLQQPISTPIFSSIDLSF